MVVLPLKGWITRNALVHNKYSRVQSNGLEKIWCLTCENTPNYPAVHHHSLQARTLERVSVSVRYCAVCFDAHAVRRRTHDHLEGGMSALRTRSTGDCKAERVIAETVPLQIRNQLLTSNSELCCSTVIFVFVSRKIMI
jgi:hypothetical protein